MKAGLRKFIFALVGLLAGLAAWSFAELFVRFQPAYPSLLIYSVSLGSTLGAVLGSFFGAGEGISMSVKSRIQSGMITGCLVGMVAGVAGFLAGQFLLVFLGDLFLSSNKAIREVGIPLSRSLGWAVMGMILGMAEGIRAKSSAKIKVGILGGLLGGVLGGVAVEFLPLVLRHPLQGRLAGLLLLGGMIGFCYSLVEMRFARGILRLLNGPLKNKEYLLLQRQTLVGKSSKADIKLEGYPGVEDEHIKLHLKGERVILEALNPKQVALNDKKPEGQELRLEDVLQVGGAKFLFTYL